MTTATAPTVTEAEREAIRARLADLWEHQLLTVAADGATTTTGKHDKLTRILRVWAAGLADWETGDLAEGDWQQAAADAIDAARDSLIAWAVDVECRRELARREHAA